MERKKCNKCLAPKDIDHIIPVSSGLSEKEVIDLNHYSNLQPLCSKINRDIKKILYKHLTLL